MCHVTPSLALPANIQLLEYFTLACKLFLGIQVQNKLCFNLTESLILNNLTSMFASLCGCAVGDFQII